MPVIHIEAAHGSAEIDQVRTLMRAYAAYLAQNPTGAANICIEGFATEMENLPAPYTVLLLACVDGEPAGCVALKYVSGGCEMKRLFVPGTFRGHGLGRRLIEAAIAWARQAGYAAMFLDTVPAAMPEANALYERLGFQRVERYNDNPVADLAFFRLTLD